MTQQIDCSVTEVGLPDMCRDIVKGAGPFVDCVSEPRSTLCRDPNDEDGGPNESAPTISVTYATSSRSSALLTRIQIIGLIVMAAVLVTLGMAIWLCKRSCHSNRAEFERSGVTMTPVVFAPVVQAEQI